MELSSELISQFAKTTARETKPADTGVTVEGTAKMYSGKFYVQLDGSDQLTPIISSTAGMKEGDRVAVLIKDHTAKVTGNVSSPSAGQSDLDEVKNDVTDQINEFEIIIADKVSTKDFDAEKARIDTLVSDNVTIKEGLNADKADIKNLKAKDAEIDGKLQAAEADIDDLTATKLDVEIADAKFATINNLEATNANIHSIEADYGDFKKLSTDKFNANEGDINRLDTEKLSSNDASIKYASIDFANIGSSAIEKFFTKSGMISDLVVGDGTITGKLVGVTIKGDLIEGGTVKADKLVVRGTDGLYYKLNTDGEKVGTEQTEYNSLNGSIITAKSITAEKVNVNDLVAFGATIGGFKITDSSLYSGVKSSIDNPTSGLFMGDDGQFAVGDSSNFIKFFKDTDRKYKLEISARSIKFGANNESIEDVLNSYKATVSETYAEKAELTQAVNQLSSTMSSNYSAFTDYRTSNDTALSKVQTAANDAQSTIDSYKTANDKAVADAKKAGTTAQNQLSSYKSSNDAAVAAAKKAGTDAQSNLNAYKTTTDKKIGELSNIANNAIESWYLKGAPTTSNPPASTWTTDALKKQHAGDLYMDVNTGYSYRWSGTAWVQVKDSDVTKALNEIQTVKTDYATKSELRSTDTELSGKISDTLTTARSYADGKIEKEVTDRNAAIKAQADSISLSVSKTYTKAETFSAYQSDADQRIATANSNASTAVSTARTAASDAATAKTNASNAVSTANGAKSTADAASKNASSAVSTANAASSTANSAKSTAATANTNASNAVTTANGAKDTADAAKSTADDAYSRTLRIELISAPADAAEDTSRLTACVYRGGELLSDQDVAQLGLIAWYVDGARKATGWTYTCAAGTAVECRLEA